jgi:hypothetical protein
LKDLDVHDSSPTSTSFSAREKTWAQFWDTAFSPAVGMWLVSGTGIWFEVGPEGTLREGSCVSTKVSKMSIDEWVLPCHRERPEKHFELLCILTFLSRILEQDLQ